MCFFLPPFWKKQDGRSQEGKTSDIFLQYFILTELRTSVFFSYIYKNEYYVFDFICNLDFFAELKIDWGFLLYFHGATEQCHNFSITLQLAGSKRMQTKRITNISI